MVVRCELVLLATIFYVLRHIIGNRMFCNGVINSQWCHYQPFHVWLQGCWSQAFSTPTHPPMRCIPGSVVFIIGCSYLATSLFGYFVLLLFYDWKILEHRLLALSRVCAWVACTIPSLLFLYLFRLKSCWVGPTDFNYTLIVPGTKNGEL